MAFITINTNYSGIETTQIEQQLKNNEAKVAGLLGSYKQDTDQVLGWMDIEVLAEENHIHRIEEKAKAIREDGEVFIIVGVGGSNQGARAAIEALGDTRGTQILYLGNNLSPNYIKKVLTQIEGKSLYINVIAKNFETLEPGLGFRVLRDYMEKVYSKEELAKRIIVTGTDGAILEEFGQEEGYMFLPFPKDVGGRFSVLSSVGLLPIAVSGIDIRVLLKGALDMKDHMNAVAVAENEAFKYAAVRDYLYKHNKQIEIMGYFEPELMYFSKWWVQLFGESEGKDSKGLFVTDCSFSEDLHAMGQFIQEGTPTLFETFLNVEETGDGLAVPKSRIVDGFEYLEGKDIKEINKAAYTATVQAHSEGNIPVCIINIPELTPYYMGQLFYFFEIACYASATLLEVNPFDQPGVEAYKVNMFKTLGK